MGDTVNKTDFLGTSERQKDWRQIIAHLRLHHNRRLRNKAEKMFYRLSLFRTYHYFGISWVFFLQWQEGPFYNDTQTDRETMVNISIGKMKTKKIPGEDFIQIHVKGEIIRKKNWRKQFTFWFIPLFFILL